MLVSFPDADPRLLAFARRLKAAREARNVDLPGLSQRADVAKLHLGLAEQGRYHFTSAELFRVTNALRLPIDFLTTDRDLKALRPIE